MSDVRLSESEREALAPWNRDGLYTCPSDRDRCDARCEPEHEHLVDAVERILAARLADRDAAGVEARVRAECDYAEDYGPQDEDGDRWVQVAVVLAALSGPADEHPADGTGA